MCYSTVALPLHIAVRRGNPPVVAPIYARVRKSCVSLSRANLNYTGRNKFADNAAPAY